MFKDPTVVLVGAGASAEFGLPTGIGLYDSAAGETENRTSSGGNLADKLLHSFWEFLRFHNMGPEQISFRNLIKELKNSHAQSIDLFAFYNPSYAEITKLYSAWKLIKEMFVVDSQMNQRGDIRRYAQRHYAWRNRRIGEGKDARNNWLGELANAFLRGAQGPQDLEANQLTFVTFNYDQVIEETFSYIVKLNEIFSETPEELFPRVIHVHGAMESPTEENLNLKFYQRQAQQISFISDTINNPPEEVVRAKRLLQEASRVYSVGFAFEELNVNLLSGGQWGRRTVALNYDGNTKVSAAMKRIGIQEDGIWTPRETEFYPVGLAASRGFFDSRP